MHSLTYAKVTPAYKTFMQRATWDYCLE